MKILELPSTNCSRIYTQANVNTFFPQKKQNPHSLTQQLPTESKKSEMPTQGFQGQPAGKGDRKSHVFKSHSPQPESYSDSLKTLNKSQDGSNVNSTLHHTHSSENLNEKDYASVGNNNKDHKTSNFKGKNPIPPPTNIFKKKESLNLFEEEEKENPKENYVNKINTTKNLMEFSQMNDGDNLMIFSPKNNEKRKEKWMGGNEFKLDEDLVNVLSGEQIAELKNQYVNQKVENKV